MRQQQKIWQNEHASSSSLPSLTESEPSSAVEYFTEFLGHQGIKDGKVVDIGCGKGRNSLYLARQGFEVYAMDYVQEAIDFAIQLSKEKNLNERIHFDNALIDSRWQFENEFFDAAVDCFSSIDIETVEGRKICRDEIYRTLKLGGYAFVSVVSAEDELEQEMMRKSPGSEKNSAVWPNGKFQKNYDEHELKIFYSNFNIVEFKKVQKPAFKLDRKYTATNVYLILQK
jgi:SAM-dependent methyltransferase